MPGDDVRINWDGNVSRKLLDAKLNIGEKLGRAVLGDMQRVVPVDEGHLRDDLTFEVSRDGDDVVVRWGAATLAPHYAIDVEFGTRPHTIESHGNYPLRNPETGQVFGRRVQHPGTPAQPYMRPSLYKRRVL